MKSAVAATAAIRNRLISATEMTEFFLENIETANPEISAIREVLQEQALDKARSIDDRIARSQPIGALAGLPVVVKENCDTAGATCSAGLAFHHENRPESDAAISSLLRKADAIILGVSVCDPGAFSTRTPDVTHPLNPDLTVGGSSGGSAAALACDMCLGAIGTDTGGSIRIPSACCGTVGLKPTFGGLPMDGIFPLVPSLDHVGPMAKSVGDTQLLWSALSRQQTPSNSTAPGCVGFDPRWLAEADDDVANAVLGVLDRIGSSGIEVREIELPGLDDVAWAHGTIFIVEALRYHMSEHGEFRGQYPDIAQDWFKVAETTPDEEYRQAVSSRRDYTRQVNDHLQSVDFIVSPTLLVREIDKLADAIRVGNRDLDFTMAMVRATSLFDHTGHPALALPVSADSNPLPPSLQLIGKNGGEAGLLQFGQWIEANVI